MKQLARDWWKNSVIYQIYPRSFQDSNGDGIGDLNGITSRLPYLQTLGVDTIWLSPVYKSPNVDNGYDISDYQDIMDDFGTMADFDRMLQTAHELGLHVMMDLVVNHTSDQHPWFVEARKSKDNPYHDYYLWQDAKPDGSLPNNWGSCFSGPAWTLDEELNQYYLHLFAVEQPDLNWENEQVRTEVFDMMNWWVDKGIDGFRMDVISLISKVPGFPDGKLEKNGYSSFNVNANGPRVHEYLQEMNRKVLQRAPLVTVGECSGVTLEEAKRYAALDDSELNMVFQFEHMDVDAENGTKWTDKRYRLTDLKEVLDRWQKGLSGIAWNSLYWNNHDQPRVVSRFGDDREEYREQSAKMLATCLHCMQGTPYIYQGEELGMTNAQFTDLSEFRDLDSINAYHEFLQQGLATPEEMLRYLNCKSRDNARTPMQWDDSPNAGFTTGSPWIKVNENYKTINAKDALARPDSVFYTYQKLIRLRHEQPLLTKGVYESLNPHEEETWMYTRRHENEALLVVCNFTDRTVPVEIPAEFADGEVWISNENRTDASLCTLSPYEAIAIFHQ